MRSWIWSYAEVGGLTDVRQVFPVIKNEFGDVLYDDGSLFYRPIGVLVATFLRAKGFRRARRPYIKLFVNENRILTSQVATPSERLNARVKRKLRNRDVTYEFDHTEDFHLFVYANDVQNLDVNVHERQSRLDITSSYLLCGLARGIFDAEIAHLSIPLDKFPDGQASESRYLDSPPDVVAPSSNASSCKRRHFFPLHRMPRLALLCLAQD